MPRVLHVVVGHRLGRYFLNAVRSVRAAAPGDPLLIVDNASPDAELRDELERIRDQDALVDVIFRAENDVRKNRKVGSLYAAYQAAFDHAMTRQFDYLHLVQSDFQVLWWDRDLVARSAEIFAAHPRCVNISMRANPRDMTLSDDLTDPPGPDGLRTLRWYGLTDTGLYHLGRWRDRGMRFGPSEREHARRYLDEGLEVVCHPWPTDVPIPWPAVVRNGVERGRQVVTGKPFLIKPLSAAEVRRLKSTPDGVWHGEHLRPLGLGLCHSDVGDRPRLDRVLGHAVPGRQDERDRAPVPPPGSARNRPPGPPEADLPIPVPALLVPVVRGVPGPVRRPAAIAFPANMIVR